MTELIQMINVFAATAEHAEEEAQGIAALGIDPLAILAQGVTFLLLFFVIKKFALSSIVETLEKRRKTIDDGVRLGIQMEKEKNRLDEEVEKILAKARVEADKIIAAGNQEAGAIIREAEEAASRKADAILADARARIDEDLKRARQGLEQEVVALVAEAAEVIISEKVNAEKDRTLIERALAGVRR